MLANVTVSVSTDNPEAGLDAMLQAAVCPEVSFVVVTKNTHYLVVDHQP